MASAVETALPQRDLPAITNAQAIPFLSQFISRSLRIHVSDGRMFIGQMRCTDKDRNIILAQTHEYRQPSADAVRDALASSSSRADAAAAASSSAAAAAAAAAANPSSAPSVKLHMTSRFVGLVVVPGQYITKIEYEQSLFKPEPQFPDEAPEA